jgi:hypothetical protein
MTDGEKKATWLAYLGTRLQERYDNDGRSSDLDRAIKAISQAINIDPPKDSKLPDSDLSLADLLGMRYDHTNNPSDLEKSIYWNKTSLASLKEDDPISATALHRLANQLGTLYERTTNGRLLDEAIVRATEANKIQPQNGKDKVVILNTLAHGLAVRYDNTENGEDIEKSILHAEEALQLVDKDDLAWPAFINNLSVTLIRRYEEAGDLRSLQKATELLTETLDIPFQNDINRAPCNIALFQAFSQMYQRTGNLQEIEWAVLLSKSVTELESLDPLDRAIYLNSLGNSLEVLFDRTRQLKHLQAAISAEGKAVSIFPRKHCEHPRTLRSLADKLGCLHSHSLQPSDLEKALVTEREALDTLPEYSSGRDDYFHTLGNLLEEKFEMLSDHTECLDEAICIGQKALSFTSKSSPTYALSLFDQYRRLEKRHQTNAKKRKWTSLKEPTDLYKSVYCFLEASEAAVAPPLVKVRAARAGARLLSYLKRYEKAAGIVEGLLDLLPLVCGRYASRTDQQYAVSQTSGLASDACSLIFKSGQSAPKALQKREFGRGLILNYIIESFAPGGGVLDGLKKVEPRLADLFQSLQFKASATASGLGGVIQNDTETALKRTRGAVNQIVVIEELRRVIDAIREIPGFKRFLMEPTIDRILSLASVQQRPASCIKLHRDKRRRGSSYLDWNSSCYPAEVESGQSPEAISLVNAKKMR